MDTTDSRITLNPHQCRVIISMGNELGEMGRGGLLEGILTVIKMNKGIDGDHFLASGDHQETRVTLIIGQRN